MYAFEKELTKKISQKKAVVGIVGLGYVGLPLAVTVAIKKFKTIGFDIQKKRTDMVNQGISYIGDVDEKELKEAVRTHYLEAGTDFSRIRECDIVCIAVPTPLDKYHQPNVRYVLRSTKEIAKAVKKGTLIILESTTYPGTTEEVVAPIFEKKGLAPGKDYFLSFSPERVDPGNDIYKTKNTPKVVGGMTRSCNRVTEAFYSAILDAPVTAVSSPKTAEMEKILENTFRNINIGLINEMAILCYKMGIDIWEVIEAASTKPYGFMPFYPGPGIGGHCIPIDPFYLTWKAREFDYHTRLIETSSEINNYMPEFVVERIFSLLNRNNKTLQGAVILFLGVAYKKNISDMRESPALKILDLLNMHGADVRYNDPFVPSFIHRKKTYVSVPLKKEVLDSADLILMITDHSVYDPADIIRKGRLIFDTRNMTKGYRGEGVERL